MRTDEKNVGKATGELKIQNIIVVIVMETHRRVRKKRKYINKIYL